MKFRKIMKESEEDLREQYKDILDKVDMICKKHDARTKNVYMSRGDELNIVFAVDDKDRTPGVGFNMNAIMGAGYGIEKDLKKAGIPALVGAGGYVGNSSKITIFTNLLEEPEFNEDQKMINENEREEATDGEAMVTETIFDALSKVEGFMVDFADNGYEIYLTDTADDSCYTISIKQDE